MPAPTPLVVGPFTPLSGITGSVKIGADEFAFGKWTLSQKSAVVPVNTFKSAPYRRVVGSLKSADLSLEAPTYDKGNLPFIEGERYDFILGLDATASLTVGIVVETIEMSADVEGAQPYKLSGLSDGPWLLAVT